MNESLKEGTSCFYCEYFYHRDPDSDGCRKHHSEVWVDTPACKDFKKQGRTGGDVR